MSIKSDFKTIIESVNNNGTKPYDSTGVVRRVEGDTIWVHIAGGVDETPVKKTVNAKVGDKVQVRVSGGRAFIVGNETAPPTDDTTARSAITMATDAEESANNARSYANSAFISAQQAKADAEEAEQAAGTAKQAADTALVELANVQDVAGVLEWITNHGEMVSQSGGTFNPYEVYFILDPNGVYEVQGSNYSIVSEPKAEDIDDYFVLNVDKSIQNYVSTHIAVNSEGLWLIPEDNATPTTSSRKILIAVGGEGHTYSEAGTYIINKIDGADKIMAKFTENAVQVGEDGKARLEMTTDNMTSYNADSVPFFDVDYDGGVITQGFKLSNPISRVLYYHYRDIPSSAFGDFGASQSYGEITSRYNFDEIIEATGIVATINTDRKTIVLSNPSIANFVLGTAGERVIRVKFRGMGGIYTWELRLLYDGEKRVTIEGKTTPLPSGRFSISFNLILAGSVRTKAPSFYFGSNNSEPQGGFASTFGEGLTAEGSHQTAIGKYNANRTNDLFEIGYGTNSTPKNVFDVDNSGKVRCGNNQGTLTALLDLIHPVGSYYWTSEASFNPQNVFGGQWEKLDEGITLVSAGTTYTIQSGTAKDGGSKGIQAHTHSVSKQPTFTIPNHQHSLQRQQLGITTGSTNRWFASGTTVGGNTANDGGGGSCSRSQDVAVGGVNGLPTGQSTGDAGNMPPYKCAYCWHRIG